MAISYTIVGAVMAVVSSILWLWKRRGLYRVSWQCEGPLALPLIGNAWSLVSNRNDYHSLLNNLCRTHSSPVRFWAGTNLILIAHDSDDFETVFKSSSCLKRLFNYQFIRDAISEKSDGLFTSHGHTWKTHRRFVGQAIGLHLIYSQLPIFNAHMMKLVKDMDGLAGGEEFDIRHYINRTAVSMFLEAMLGGEFTTEEKNMFSVFLTRGQQIVGKRLHQPWYQHDFIWNLTSYPSELQSYKDYLAEFMDRILASKKPNSTGERTIVSRLMRVSEENPEFGPEDVKAEITTLLFGASDTTSLAIAFTVLMLAIHPKCQERVYAELVDIMPDPNTPLTGVHIEAMEYTNRCIKESMRLFPPVPMVGRTVEQPMDLKGIKLQPGQGIILAVNQLHRDPKIWGERAHEFDPDNFLPERMAKRPNIPFSPFADGARICIAFKYAIMITRAMIFHLFRHHRYSSKLRMDELQIEYNVNVRLRNNHMVSVHRR